MARAALLCSRRPCLTALAFDDVHGVNDAGTNPVIVGVGKTLGSQFLIAAHSVEDFRSDEVTRFAVLVDTVALKVCEP